MRDRWTCRNSVAVSGQFVHDKHSTKRRCVISHFSCLPFAGICREITITSLIVRTQQFQSNQRWRGLCGAPHPSALMFVVGQVFGVLFNSRRPQFNCAEWANTLSRFRFIIEIAYRRVIIPINEISTCAFVPVDVVGKRSQVGFEIAAESGIRVSIVRFMVVHSN